MLLKLNARYGLYATVFLYKAKCAGAFQNDIHRKEVADLVLRFMAVMKEAPSVETHICHGYSRMLRQLWERPEITYASRTTRPDSNTDMSSYGREDFRNAEESTRLPLAKSPVPPRAYQDSPAWEWESLGNMDSCFMSEDLGQGNDAAAFPTIEAYPFGSFWPGIKTFWQQEEVQNVYSEQEDPSADGFHEVGVRHIAIGFPGTI